MADLPPFPLDPETLDLLELALQEGAVASVLLLLSGYDERQARDPDRRPAAGHLGPLLEAYDWPDVLGSLIGEVRRLRALVPEPF